jgi:DNA-binding NarL/FixJ family response regulator
MKTTTIMIADDHPLMRDALYTALEEEADLKVVCQASSGFEVLDMFETYQPDVIIMDLLMPGMNGLETIARILDANPQARILVVSILEATENILEAIQTGALGYFPKTQSRATLVDAVRQVSEGIPYLPAGVAQKLFDGLRAMKGTETGRQRPAAALTPRQQEILALLVDGRSDPEIGKLLHLSTGTVRSHIHNMLTALRFTTRAELIAFAKRVGD